VYQDGRGNDPMIEVGNTTFADALYIHLLLLPRAWVPDAMQHGCSVLQRLSWPGPRALRP
jgi:hypothetical protein